MTEPGFAALARAREAAGLSLEDVARQLKFAPRQLQALEAGELQRLPGGTFVRGMVRSYARLLHLDPEPLLAQVGAHAAPQDAERLAQRFRQPVPFSDGARRSNLAYVALSLALLAVVVVVALEWRQERASAPRMAFVSAAQQPAEPPRAAIAEPPGVTVASAAPSPRVQAARVQATQGPAKQVQVPAAARSADEPAAAGQGRIVLQFDGESWVEIHSGTGKLLVAQLHASGTERVVSGVPPFAVVIGNAQQVRISYNNKPVDLMPYVKVEVARFTLE
jgi:cytoskeleton protein RodZ